MLVTVYAYGDGKVLKAESARRMARLLYLTCPWWTHEACDLLVAQLERGQVVLARDFDTVLVPGDWPVLEVRPAEDEAWVPAAVA